MSEWYECDFLYHSNPRLLRHDVLIERLDELATRGSDLSMNTLGVSSEGREIRNLTIGTGPVSVLMWSQMHGDEPTHTGVILALLDTLTSDDRLSGVDQLLAECQLHIIPMLNPDGVERQSRFNAQGIDVNRDARNLQSPEARLLRNAVLALQPDFAFNLHNQNPRTAIHGRQAVVSLLVPPMNEAATDTPATIDAKKLASKLCQALATVCDNQISRYDADYMPRCFGEWVQSTGARTLLIEAGGWDAQSATIQDAHFYVDATGDWRQLCAIHYFALATALRSVATGAYRAEEVSTYEALPRSDAEYLMDWRADSILFDNGCGHPRFAGSIGVNFDVVSQGQRNGVIAELGDLQSHGRVHLQMALESECRPGAIVFDPGLTPIAMDHYDWERWLAAGVTTVLGVCPLADPCEVERLLSVNADDAFPLNVAFIGDCLPIRPTSGYDKNMVRCVARRLLGLIDRESPSATSDRHPASDFPNLVEAFSVPVLPESVLTANLMSTIQSPPAAEHDLVSLLRFRRRGRIGRGKIADVVFQGKQVEGEESPTMFLFLAGHPAGQVRGGSEAEIIDSLRGRLLTRESV